MGSKLMEGLRTGSQRLGDFQGTKWSIFRLKFSL